MPQLSTISIVVEILAAGFLVLFPNGTHALVSTKRRAIKAARRYAGRKAVAVTTWR